MNRKVFMRPLVATAVLICLLIGGIAWVNGQDSTAQSEPSRPYGQTTTTPLQAPLGTSFTYQGVLEDEGQPADGTYDFSFRLLDGPEPGTANQVGSPLAVDDVSVTDGIFTVELDFGASPFGGEARWLELSVARDGETLEAIAPTQHLTAVPYALYGEDADADPANEYNTNVTFSGTTLQITDGGGTLAQDIGTFNGNLIITTNGRLGVREPSPTSDLHIDQSDGLVAGTGGASFSRSTTWKILHTGIHFSFVLDNARLSYVDGTNGSYVVVSDEASKKNVEPLGPVLDDVLELEPVQFHYLAQEDDAAKNYGFIAQEVAKTFPELARSGEDGTMGLAYADFGILAVASIQEQQAQIDALQRENDALRAEIDEIKSLLGQGNAAGAAAETLQFASMSAATPARPGSIAGSLFSWANLGLVALLLMGVMLLWNRQQRNDS